MILAFEVLYAFLLIDIHKRIFLQHYFSTGIRPILKSGTMKFHEIIRLRVSKGQILIKETKCPISLSFLFKDQNSTENDGRRYHREPRRAEIISRFIYFEFSLKLGRYN